MTVSNSSRDRNHEIPQPRTLVSDVGAGWRFCAALWVVAAVSLVLFDIPIARWMNAHETPKLLDELLSAVEHFGTPFGQVMVLGTILTIQGRQAVWVVRIFVGSCVAGLLANGVKLCVARVRPRAFDFDSQGIWDGFVQWFPLGQGGSGWQSFPSAHTASAFAFAALLMWRYPHGRFAFLTLATLTGMQRIVSAAHYPSDVLVGASIGWLTAMAYLYWSPLAGWWDRFEVRWNPQESPHIETA